MNKVIGFLMMVTIVTAMSCTNKATEAKKEVLIVPAPTVVIKKPAAEKETTIALDKNGVKIVTKKQ